MPGFDTFLPITQKCNALIGGTISSFFTHHTLTHIIFCLQRTGVFLQPYLRSYIIALPLGFFSRKNAIAGKDNNSPSLTSPDRWYWQNIFCTLKSRRKRRRSGPSLASLFVYGQPFHVHARPLAQKYYNKTEHFFTISQQVGACVASRLSLCLIIFWQLTLCTTGQAPLRKKSFLVIHKILSL